MRGKTFAVVVCAVLLAGVGLTQAQAPKPTDAHKKLGFFVGTWSTEGQLMENPFMPAGPFTSKGQCEWFDGGFAVVCRSKGEAPTGPTAELGIMGYNTDAQVYTYYGLDNGPMAMLSVPRGKLDGNTWVYDDESEYEGKSFKSRFTMVQTSPDSYTFEWAMAGEDGTYQTMMKGTSKKVQ